MAYEAGLMFVIGLDIYRCNSESSNIKGIHLFKFKAFFMNTGHFSQIHKEICYIIFFMNTSHFSQIPNENCYMRVHILYAFVSHS